jgi:hypothetical protein
MNTNIEDELLRSLIKKAGMVKAPDNLTSRIMEQIIANPGIEPARKFYYDWWWSGFGLLCILSMYFTGVFGFIAGAFGPWFNEAYNILSGYAGRLAGLFPSSEVMLPSSLLLPVLIPGILLILLIDAVFGRDLRRVV